MTSNSLHGPSDYLANKLSSLVTDKAAKDAPPILADSLDLFVRKTPGGKLVMDKLGAFNTGATLLTLAIGFGLGYMVATQIRK
jgi:hypothetical protein